MSVEIRLMVLVAVLCLGFRANAQEETSSQPPVAAPTENAEPNKPESGTPSSSTAEKLKESAGKLATKTEQEVEKLAKSVDQIPQAQTASAGILKPIYVVAEALAFPAFHWVAFALMTAGVVSFAFQLVLGKLVVLTRLGFSLKEIVSDAVGLAISVFGLVLTTQAAAENSTFTQSPAAVISAAAVGAISGIILYFWGQSQEIEAAAGRSKLATHAKK